jgi:hypothetical protein
MTIEALALLRLAKESLPPAAHARVTALDDGLLLRTGEPFARAPEELSVVVRALIGAQLDTDHRDPRGIFFIPDVAAPQAKTYEQVVAEVGEGGVWGPLVDTPELPDGAAGFQALLGNLLGQLPGSLLATANAAAAGQPGAFEAMGAQLSNMLQSSPQLSGLAAQLSGMLDAEPPAAGASASASASAPTEVLPAELSALLGGSGVDFSQLAANVRAELERDPSGVAAFAERFLGKDDSDDREDPK